MLSFEGRFLTQRAASPAGLATWRVSFAVLALAPLLAWGQAHEQHEGNYVLRASTVSAEALPEPMRRAHGIPSGSGKAVLNVTVQRLLGSQTLNVPARVEVTAQNLMGVTTSVDVRQVLTNGMVSYLGVYDFLPREVLEFRIRAWPQGTKSSIALSFTDRLGLQ
ncbi:DUF4426 domain-containing protein [Azohydromonas lata]|uniref:DUF4426 domain-containing protein n=1 Tax=Azohydromonas lata TaxID=45677 RepID=UPI0012F4DEF3|nr:DUF4426 domain-containing protein [Azohydromonas lata]